MPVFKAVVGLGWTCFYIYWAIAALRAKKSIRRFGWARCIAVRLVVFALLIFASHSWVHHRVDLWRGSPNLAINLCGLALCAAGFAFAIWARLHIGRNWGIPMSAKAEPELVTSGPYKLVRHPIYSGILLAMTGSALVFGTLVALVAGIFAVYAIYSAAHEEKYLLETFPEEYALYRAETKFLVPYLF